MLGDLTKNQYVLKRQTIKKSSHASHLPFDPALAEADALLEDFARF